MDERNARPVKPVLGIRTFQVQRATGLSLRKLQWWQEKNHWPVKHKNHHLWPLTEAMRVAIVHELRDRGMVYRDSKILVRRHLPSFESIFQSGKPFQPLWFLAECGEIGRKTMRMAEVACDPGRIITFGVAARSAVYVIPLEDLMLRILSETKAIV